MEAVALGDDRPRKPVDFFISYTSADRRWAEWIAWQLEEAGYRVLIQAWDIVPGANFVERMDRAIHDAARTIAVLSPDYLTSVYTKLELQAAFRGDPDGLRRRLLPVRVAPCEPEGLLAVLVYIDLVGIDDEAAAREALIESVRQTVAGRGKPDVRPTFPAARAIPVQPQFPGTGPARGPRDAGAFTVLHLSEPRFGGDEPAAGLADLAGDVERLAAEVGARPDLLVVTGDLAEAGRPSELVQAHTFLVGLAERLDLSRDRVVVVPGDHDVSRSACRAYFSTCDADELAPAPPYWPKWRHYSRMVDELYRDAPGATFDQVHPWSLFEVPECKVVVAGLNSTMAESHRDGDHHGWVGEEQARWFVASLARYEEAGWLRLGAVHHNPLASRPEDALRDVETVDGLLGRRLHLLLHGHDREDAPAGELASGLVLAGTGAAGGAVRRYQLVRVGADGLLRWPRHLDAASGRWQPESPRRLARSWQGAPAVFPEAGAPAASPAVQRPAERETGLPWEAQAVPGDGLLARVAEVCALRHAGSIVKRIDGEPPHLLVTYQEEGFVRQLRVGVQAGTPTPSAVETFIARVHAIDPEPGSVLVYQGEPPEDDLTYQALSRGVRLLSFAEYRGLLDLRGYVARQRRRLAGDGLYPPELYVPQRYRPLDLLNAPVADDLPEAVLRLLASDQGRFILLLGDFGRGKTFLLRELARRIPERLPHLTPVLIELRALEKAHTVEELVAQHLAAYGEERIDLAAFRYMLRTGGIALLFDGFDELALRMTYDRAAMHLETLLQAAEGQAKIVATSRTQHFVSHAQALTALGERVGLVPSRRLLEVEDFTEEQIRAFLVNRYGDRERADARLETLRSVRDLLGLSRNPRMLWFIADLDEDQLRAAQARTGEISAAELYRQILDRWLTYEVNRLEVAGSPATLDKGQRWDAVTALALRLWQSHEGAIELGELSKIAVETLTDLADLQMTEDQAAHVVGSGTLLVLTGEGRFAFVHASVMEWLVAADVARRFAAGDASPSPLRLRQMSPLMVEFLCDLAQPASCRDWADAALADPDAGDAAKQNALRIAERIRSSAWVRADLRGRNLRGEDLSERNLRGADLTDADLTEASLAGADLTGAILRRTRLVDVRLDRARLVDADLTDADLTRARLLGTDLTGATVTGSRWLRAALVGVTAGPDVLRTEELGSAAIAPGQRVGMELGPASVGVSHSFERGALVADLLAFSPDGQTVAVGVEDGGILICDAQSGLPVRRLAGHTQRIWSMAFAAGGRLLVSTSADRTVRLWDPVTGEPLRTLSDGGRLLWPAAVTPDGRLVAAGGEDGVLRLWAADTGREDSVRAAHDGRIWSLAISPDGSQVATAGNDGHVVLHDRRGVARHRIAGSGAPIWRVAFSPDGRRLAAAANDGSVTLWDEESGTLRLDAHRGPVWSVAFRPDGSRLATVGADHAVRIWNAATGRPVRTLAGHEDEVWTAVFSPDGTRLATAGNDHSIRVWDMADGEPLHVLTGHTGSIWSLAFRPDGGLLASTGNDDTLRLWDLERGRAHQALRGHGMRVWSVAFSPDGGLLASSGSDHAVRLWDPGRGRPRRLLHGSAAQFRMLAISPDGRLIATTGNDGSVRLWDAGTGQLHHTVSGRTDFIWALAFSADGRLLATANDDDTVRLWDTATGREQGVLAGHRGRVRSIAFGPAGVLVATACDDRTARLWTLDGEVTHTLSGHTDRVYSVAFHPRGGMLATGSSDGTARVWDTENGRELRVLTGHSDRVWAVAFSPDGSRLATAGADHTVPIWDVATGRRLHALLGHTDQVWSAAFSPDGRMLATASNDGTVRIWDVAHPAPADGGTVLLGLRDGWAALAADGRYKVEGDPAGRFWYAIGQCRFEPGELDPYLPAIRRMGEEDVF
jgi:WD40 repeat protein/3',5'-cyclic AMP phosphodiesterase CpdA